LTAPAAVAGKKVRCKSCGHTFVAQAAAGQPAAAKPAAPKAAAAKPPATKDASTPAKTASPPAKPPTDEEEEEQNSNPYDVKEADLSARCPYCASAMPSEDAIICLECGYNTLTRIRIETRRIHHTSGFEWFLWLAPGILGAIFVLGAVAWLSLYWINADDWFGENDPWYLYMWRKLFFKLWSSVLLVFGMYHAGKYALRRLIFNPRPPEYEKK
jgi:hypothetical protein